MRIAIFILIGVIGYLSTEAQINREIDIENYIEEVFAVQDSDLSYEELYESLLLFYTNPINLNQTNSDELRSLHLLSEVQLNNFFDHIRKYGKLLSIYELQAIAGFDLLTIYRLLPFVQVRESSLSGDNRPFFQRLLSEKNNYLLLRYERVLEQQKGFKPSENSLESRYNGSPDKMYARFRVNHTKDFSIGFTAEKDAGESLTWNKSQNTYGADFYSFHFQTQSKGRLKNLILGDYQIQYGQSLLLGAGFSIGKGGETINTVRKTDIGLRPYTSVLETGFFRGVGATVELKQGLDFTTFYSRIAQDAIRRSDSSRNAFDFVSTIQSSGLHRTQNEVAAKDGIVEQNAGVVLHFKDPKSSLSAGAILIGNRFSSTILKSNILANRFEFSGKANLNTGLFASYNWHNFAFFGEASRSKSGGLGAVGGIIISLSSKLETSLVGRSYDRDFHSFYGNAFAESVSSNQNERGFYWGLKYKPSRKFRISSYFDRFSFPWLRQNISTPSMGHEYLLRAVYQPTRSTNIYIQFREESKLDNISSIDQVSQLKQAVEGIKRNSIINLDYQSSDNISFKSRAQFSSYEFNGSTTLGSLILQDVNITYKKFRLSARFALFDTDDFDNRQYVYEKDVLYAFSIPALSGRGSRQYLLLQYKLNRHLTFWIKFARTHFRNRKVVGSGLQEIEGNIRSDLKLQMRLRL